MRSNRPMLRSKPMLGASGATGATGATGDDGFDISKISDLTGGAKLRMGAMTRRLPHDEHDPDAPVDRATNLRTNAYHRALFKYVGAKHGESMQRTILALAVRAALAEVDENTG